VNVPENLDPPPFNSFPVAARSSSRSGCTRLGSRSPFNSFPVAAVGFDPVYPVVYKLFQFFPSCCSGLKMGAVGESIRLLAAAFNSFPVAARALLHGVRPVLVALLSSFNSFPVAAGAVDVERVARAFRAFNSFPVAALRASTIAVSRKASSLSILSQLLQLKERDWRSVVVLETFNSFPVAAERSDAGAAEQRAEGGDRFQFFPSCCRLRLLTWHRDREIALSILSQLLRALGFTYSMIADKLAFNSFPVAATPGGVPMTIATIVAFNSFPVAASPRARAAGGARTRSGTRPAFNSFPVAAEPVYRLLRRRSLSFNSFPVAAGGEGVREGAGEGLLSILSQLLLLGPALVERVQQPLHFQFFPSCCRGTS